jgi:hypothetical protein
MEDLMNSKNKAPKQSIAAQTVEPTPEADFDDTIAHNRGLQLLAPTAVPYPPSGYRPTDAESRLRRLRRISGELRSEAREALHEAGGRDLQAELGRFAPEPRRAVVLAERLGITGDLVARAQALLDYAKESDQIAMSDALVFLESEHKQYLNAIGYDATLTPHYRALVALFEMRSGAIAEGIARSRTADPAPTAKPVSPPAPAPAPAAKPASPPTN